MIDLHPLVMVESSEETHDFGREEVLATLDPRRHGGVDTAEDQLDALIADELFTA